MVKIMKTTRVASPSKNNPTACIIILFGTVSHRYFSNYEREEMKKRWNKKKLRDYP